jgi:plastocyanin
MRRRIGAARVLVAGVLLAAAASGCGADDTAADHAGIGITGTRFDPASLDVPAAPTTIVIANNDPFTHTFTLDDGSIDREIPAGATVRIIVELTRTTGFHCRMHPSSMSGTLTVA